MKIRYWGTNIIGASPYLEKGKEYLIDKNESGYYQIHYQLEDQINDQYSVSMVLFEEEFKDLIIKHNKMFKNNT